MESMLSRFPVMPRFLWQRAHELFPFVARFQPLHHRAECLVHSLLVPQQLHHRFLPFPVEQEVRGTSADAAGACARLVRRPGGACGPTRGHGRSGAIQAACRSPAPRLSRGRARTRTRRTTPGRCSSTTTVAPRQPSASTSNTSRR